MTDVRKRLKRYTDKELPERLNRWLHVWGLKIVGDAQRRLTRAHGGRDTGRLAGSIAAQNEIRGSRVEMRVGTNTKYARWVEGYPTVPRRHFLPFAGHPDFAGWAHRRLKLSWAQIDSSRSTGRSRVGSSIGHTSRTSARRSYRHVDWKSRRKIRGFMVGGAKSIHPFLRPALKQNLQRMQRDARRI